MYPGIHALTTPDKPALIMAATGRQVTYAALEDRSLRIANWLRSQGFKRGDVIALLSDNDARTFDVYWAAQRCGLYLTAINVHLKRDEVRYILENSGARALFLGNTGAELAGAWDALPHLVHRVSFEEGVTDFLPLEALIASASSVRPAHEPPVGPKASAHPCLIAIFPNPETPWLPCSADTSDSIMKRCICPQHRFITQHHYEPVPRFKRWAGRPSSWRSLMLRRLWH